MKPRAVIKEQERERELQICAAEKPLLVKILFEEDSVKCAQCCCVFVVVQAVWVAPLVR